MRKRNVWAGFAAGLLVGLLVASFAAHSAEDRKEKIIQEFFAPLAWLVDQVETSYVDEVDLQKLRSGACQGMLNRLDKYCTYYSPEYYRELKAETEGEFGGLGMEIYYDPLKKVVVVERPIPGTPAFTAGILGGDMIIEIRECSTGAVSKTEDFEDVHDALKVLRGKEGTEVTITVIRGANTEKAVKKDFTVRRDTIKIPSIRGTQMIAPEKKIGYIYVAEFHERLVADLRKELEQLRDEGMKGLILDLRFNRGGLLDSALRVSDLFLDEGLIVSTKGRSSPPKAYYAGAGQFMQGLSLVVLANHYSASAAEIVAAALSQNHRAVLVGEPSFGKASVQTIFKNRADDSAVKLTTAHYYTPNGDLIEGKGVQPDVEVKLSDEELLKLMKYLSHKLDFAADQPEALPEPPSPEDKGAQKPAAQATSQQPQASGPQSAESTAASEKESLKDFRDVQLDRALLVMDDLLAGKGPVPAQPKEAANAAAPTTEAAPEPLTGP
jgi:carboxyl-terminal processing protease